MNYFRKTYQKDMTPTYTIVCVCISSYSVDKKIAHCWFSIEKKRIVHTHFWMYRTTGNVLNFFWGTLNHNLTQHFENYGSK